MVRKNALFGNISVSDRFPTKIQTPAVMRRYQKLSLKKNQIPYMINIRYCIIPVELFYIERGCNSRTEI
jgi:hypothetical protein